MRRKLLKSMRMLLVAAGLSVGASAWADTQSGSVDFSAKSRCSYSTDTHTYTTNSDAGNGYALAVADLSGLANIASATSVTLEFDVVISGRLIIGIGDKSVRGTNAHGSSKVTYDTDGIIMRYATTDGKYVRVNGGTNNDNAMSVTSHVTFTLNRKTNKYSYTITNADGDVTFFSESNLSASVNNATIVEAYSWAGGQSNALSAVSYSYELESFDYTIKAVDDEGADLKTFTSGTSSDGAVVAVNFPKAFKHDGVWYVCDETMFKAEATYVNPNPTITYRADKSIVYYAEAGSSDIEGTKYSFTYTSDLYSNGSAYCCNKSSYFKSKLNLTSTGSYNIEAGFGGRYAIADYMIQLTDGSTTTDLGTVSVAKDGYNVVNYDAVMTAGLEVYCNTDNGSSGPSKWILDYILVRKNTEPATVGANGYATFASPYALDLTDANRPAGLKAYKATLTSSTLTFTELNQTVPAGTGLLLLGETKGGTYNIPVVASGDAVANDLVGVTADTPLKSTEDGIFYFVMKKASAAEDALAFAPLSTESAVTIPAGKAYVALDTSTGARSLTVAFDDDVTGIKSVNGEGGVATGFYNLNGQRVGTPAKGLYIVKGKKVVLK